MVVLRQEIAATPASAPEMVARTLKAAGTSAASEAGPVTLAAIQGLGSSATPKKIAAIVYSAVRATPDSALQIVRTAVGAAPKAAPEIAAAVALAVPNPWKDVRYQRGAPAETTLSTMPPALGRKERDFKSEPDYKSPVDRAFNDPQSLPPANTGDPMTLAEAIVQAAIDAGGDPGATQQAVDSALFGDPGQLFDKVSGSKGISGVGDAGDSNYANEPFDPGRPGGPKSPKLRKPQPPKNPNPGVVSP